MEVKNFTFFYYVLYSPPDVSSTSVNYPQLTFSDVKALAEELDNLEINIGNICVGHMDSQCVTLVMDEIKAQVGNGNTQILVDKIEAQVGNAITQQNGASVAQTQGRKISK